MKKALLIATITTILVLAAASMASAASTAGYGPMVYDIINGPVSWIDANNVLQTDGDNTGVDNDGNPLLNIDGGTMYDPQDIQGEGTLSDSTENQWEYWSANTGDSAGQGYKFVGFDTSTHPQGTWNSPYTLGIDGYNYNDPQDYVIDNNGYIGWGDGVNASDDPNPLNGMTQGFMFNPMMNPNQWFPLYVYSDDDASFNPFAPGFGLTGDEYWAASTPGDYGPHGDYRTSTHKCRECHAVHRAAGKFKLTRSDTRMEACDWCHGTGAGSGFNIQMDNNADMTREYDVGHSLGFGLSSGKWKAPDDTDPAYTPKFYLGGFSCFDCHSPHANKQRIMGWIDSSRAGGPAGTQIPGIVINSGATEVYQKVRWPLTEITGAKALKPIFPAGKWLLLENPDANEGFDDVNTTASTPDNPGLPINKMPINWNFPFGTTDEYETLGGQAYLNMATCFGNLVSEFCTDCHDGNAGLHTQQAAMFSEDRALRNQASAYDIGYSHDTNPRH